MDEPREFTDAEKLELLKEWAERRAPEDISFLPKWYSEGETDAFVRGWEAAIDDITAKINNEEVRVNNGLPDLRLLRRRALARGTTDRTARDFAALPGMYHELKQGPRGLRCDGCGTVHRNPTKVYRFRGLQLCRKAAVDRHNREQEEKESA